MSDQIPPVAPVAPVEPPELHPSWKTALDEAGVPDLFYAEGSPLRAQIIRSEAAANKRIEEAVANQLDPEWRDLYDSARSGGVKPGELFQAYNNAHAIAKDPVAFYKRFREQIAEGVRTGAVTVDEADRALFDVGQQVQDNLDLTDPVQRQLLQRVEAVEQIEAQRQQAATAQQEAAEQEAFSNNFVTTLQTKMAEAGFGEAANETLTAVYNMADSLHFTQNVPVPDAIDKAIVMLQGLVGQRQQAAAQTAAGGAPPIGGGNQQAVMPQVQKFSPDDMRNREAAMIKAGQDAIAGLAF